MGTEDDLLKFIQQVSKDAEKGKPSKEVGKKNRRCASQFAGPGGSPRCWVLRIRTVQNDHNLRIAFALKAYHKDNGRYPAKLTDLAPKYIASVPDDLFSGKPLIYKPAEKRLPILQRRCERQGR